MSRYRIYIIFSAIVSAGLLAVLLISLGHYPIMMVNGDFISAGHFLREYRAASRYYGNFLQTYESAAKGEEKLSERDIQLIVLDGLVEKSLISSGAKKAVGNDLSGLVSKKLQGIVGDQKLESMAASLYGLSGGEFTRDVLVPQAEREILAGRLFLNGENINDWLLGARNSASVITFSSGFSWNGTFVEIAGESE